MRCRCVKYKDGDSGLCLENIMYLDGDSGLCLENIMYLDGDSSPGSNPNQTL